MVISHWWVLIDVRVTPQVTSRKKGTEELASYLRKIAAVGQTLFYASRYISLRTLHHYALTSETQGLFPLIFPKWKTCFGIDIRFFLPVAAIGRVPTWMIIHPSCLTLKTAMKKKAFIKHLSILCHTFLKQNRWQIRLY